MTKIFRLGCLNKRPNLISAIGINLLNKRLLATFVLLYVATILNTTNAQTTTDSSCLDSEASSITYGFDVQTQEAKAQLDVTTTFQLIEATKALRVGIVAFYNGVQVDTLDKQATLKCGQSIKFSFSVATEGLDNATLHVFPRRLPVIPYKVRHSDPEHPFPNRDAYIYGTQIADVYTTVLGGNPFDQTKANLDSFYTVPNQIQTGHLFVRSKDKPTYIEYLDASQKSLDFHLFFGEIEDKQLTYTITCLLDDTQFSAFQDEAVWSAAIPDGRAALIEAKVTDLKPGWHKIQCYVLNGIVRGTENRISEYPHQIYPLFIYVR